MREKRETAAELRFQSLESKRLEDLKSVDAFKRFKVGPNSRLKLRLRRVCILEFEKRSRSTS